LSCLGKSGDGIPDREITAPIRARVQALMASSTHSMIFATGEPAYAVDRDGTIVAWNTAATRAFGYPRSTAVGRKCWDLLQGQDAFGNQYCSEHCPLREMASRHKAVNRCRMSFQTADAELQAFTVTTLVLFDTPDATLIHMCRKEPPTAREAPALAESPGARRGSGHDVLTPREREVLNHLSDGHTTREIATLLSISVPTVRNHIEHILRKLHAHSRLEAVAVSRKLGID
jgi:DNA-binding CsgD family transcriptional regulator